MVLRVSLTKNRKLGIDDTYFRNETVDVISKHVMSLYAAKMFAFTKNEKQLEINLERETEQDAVYIHTSKPGVSKTSGKQYEKRIDQKYLDESCPQRSFRLETYRSLGTVSSSMSTQLRCYFVAKCDFVSFEKTLDIQRISDKNFLEKATPNTLQLYGDILKKVQNRNGPVIESYDGDSPSEKRLVIGYKQNETVSFFSSLSHLYHYYKLYSSRKYVEQFSNGVTIMSVYLNALETSTVPIEHSVIQIMKEASLLFCLPTTPMHHHFQAGHLSIQETIYGYCALIFAQHFLNRLGGEYATLSTILDKNDATHMEVLTKMKKRLRQDTFTREYILDIVNLYPELVKCLYVNFGLRHYQSQKDELSPSLSFQRLQTGKVLDDSELEEYIAKTVCNNHEHLVFEAFLTFNRHVLKTNFYQPTKVALSFRFDPGFLPEIEYPQPVFGMFLIVANEFRGFHIRFRDVARGGIRIIRSRNREAYSINLRSLFDENYALAATQQRKNKDIPEGGSKGTILLDPAAQDKPRVAFEKYVDAILDLLIVGTTPGIKNRIVDLYGKEEILFFGPDEGTADYMDWASQHAKDRGMPTWKAFTTGKSQSMGGIPHDLFGMTTHSVHQYVLGIYRKLGLEEEQCTKLQTGGPDGDLGSNEIKISSDMTTGIVDGSGVLFDPQGIDRKELLKLAEARQMISHFDVTKLSKQGFRVLVDEMNVKLPDGGVV